jgi:hypothetical protein
MNKVTCAKCLFWKQTSREYGVCWHRPEVFPAPAATTHETASCPDWQAKVIWVKP